MNEELKRIRSKDFSQLDEKIYEDKHRADNLDATLLHLTDFQKFLIEQISNLDKNQPSSNSNLIAKSIARNFDHLKESLVKCSRIQDRCVKEKVMGLRENLQSLKKQLKQTKKALQEQTKMTEIKTNEMIETFLKLIQSRIDVQAKKNEDWEKKYQQILAENKLLKKQNLQLKTMAAQAKEIIVNRTQQCIIAKTNIEGNQRAPLRQAVSFQNPIPSIIPQGEAWKVSRNQALQGLPFESIQKRSASLKRQTSNHQLSRKSHINCLRDKQNEILKSKGVVMQELKRGKSKQKIKLVSLI